MVLNVGIAAFNFDWLLWRFQLKGLTILLNVVDQEVMGSLNQRERCGHGRVQRYHLLSTVD